MQHGQVDIVIVGADRVTRRGDAANKIGTYLKALAAHDNGVPFYVALPSSTFDFSLDDGVAEIPIEERGAAEVRIMSGKTPDAACLTFRFVRTKPPPGTGRSTSPRIGSSQGSFPNAASVRLLKKHRLPVSRVRRNGTP